MRIIEYYKDGTAKVEKVSKSFDFYETDDGYHIIPNDAVYRDRAGKLPPIAVLVDGLIAAVGSEQTRELISRTWSNMDINKDTNNRPSVSTSLMRWFGELMGKLVKFAPVIIIVGMVIYAIVATLGTPAVLP